MPRKIIHPIILAVALLACGLFFAQNQQASARDYGNQGYQQKSQHKAGKFDYYALVLSWSPSYCEATGTKRGDPQCTANRPYAFVLHGLWPQYNKRWPEYCPTKQKTWISKQLINDMLDIMPSKKLIIHEYKKHGTCSGLSPENYYKASRILYNSIKIPARYQNLTKPLLIAPSELEKDFLDVNPKLKPDMISIVCGSRRMREIRICFTKKGHLTACGPNENQSKLCRAKKTYLPPMRITRGTY